MTKQINAVKIGNVVNVSLNGKLFKKNCGTSEEANELFKLAIKAKENPTDENLKTVRAYLNEKLRVAFLCGLENDPDTGEVFLAGFNTPIPETLVEVIKEYYENGYPLDAVINFWKLLMINPDVRVRKSLFDFIKTHDFVLTDKGYMVVYKAVDYKEKAENDLLEFVTNQYLHVKKDWKCSPNKYVVYKDEFGYNITKVETAENWKDKNYEIIGKLGDLNAKLDEVTTEKSSVYTDMRTHSFDIQLGVPVKMERKDCNSDPAIDCSYGLHVGATKYVENFAGSASVILVCLVNPANVVAVPNYDHSKMRVSEYFPIALANYENGKIEIIEDAFFENDYADYEEEELYEMVEKVRSNEVPIENAINAEEEERSMSELLKILETRIIDLQ